MARPGPSTITMPVYGAAGAQVGEVLIDADSALAGVRWRQMPNGNVWRLYGHKGARQSVLLKRAVLGLLPGDERAVIHANDNKLDCRRCNLIVMPSVKWAADPSWRAQARSEHKGC